MNRIVVRSRVGSDGVLRVNVPVGPVDAEREVDVTVEPSRAESSVSREEWREWFRSMAGSWQGDFERPPQGDLDEREPLS